MRASSELTSTRSSLLRSNRTNFRDNQLTAKSSPCKTNHTLFWNLRFWVMDDGSLETRKRSQIQVELLNKRSQQYRATLGWVRKLGKWNVHENVDHVQKFTEVAYWTKKVRHERTSLLQTNTKLAFFMKHRIKLLVEFHFTATAR